MMWKTSLSAILLLAVACVPRPWVFDITNTEFKREKVSSSTFSSQQDGIGVTLQITSSRPGVIRIYYRFQNRQNDDIEYDLSTIRVRGDDRDYTLSDLVGDCCEDSASHFCRLRKGHKFVCELFFKNARADSICSTVELELGTVTVGESGERIEIGNVKATLAGLRE